MPVIVEQDPGHAAGVARLRLADASGLDHESLQLRITANMGGADRHLDPSESGDAVWSPTEKWFTAASVAPQGPGLAIDLGPSATWHLKPYQPYAVAFRDAGGSLAEDRMSWIALRLPSEAPPPSAADAIGNAGYPDAPPQPEPVSDPEPEPEPEETPADDPMATFADLVDAAPEAEDRLVLDQEEPSGKPVLLYLLAGLVVAGAVAAAIWFLVLQDGQPQEAEESVPVQEQVVAQQDQARPIPLTVEGARTYLKEVNPPGDDILNEARRFEEAGQHEAAFLLYKSAARKGSGAAALRMGRYYDPGTHSPELGVVATPDPEIAANWFEDAARTGEVDAMERLGEMLKQGDVERPDAPEQGVFWLNKAAEAGSEKARELLR